jgi:hypothetical protein
MFRLNNNPISIAKIIGRIVYSPIQSRILGCVLALHVPELVTGRLPRRGELSLDWPIYFWRNVNFLR